MLKRLFKSENKELCLIDGVKSYMDSLPAYEGWASDSIQIETPGNYLLPIDPVRYQWYFLSSACQYACNAYANFVLDGTFFDSLPGIERVTFEKAYFKWRSLDRSFRMADIAESMIDGQKEDFRTKLKFLPTIFGAISAFFFVSQFDYYVRYWHALYGYDYIFILHESDSLMKRPQIVRNRKPIKFGLPYSDLIPIPWGVRLEVIHPNHFIVRCLGDSMSSGLCDLSAEVEDGVLVRKESILLYKNQRIRY